MQAQATFLIFQFLLVSAFAAALFVKGRLRDAPGLAKKLVRINIVVLDPLIVFWTIWGLKLSGDLVYLPLAGLLLSGAGFLVARASLPLLDLSGTAAKSYLISASLSNHGFTMGGFVCYLLAGEKGLAMGAIFVSYFLPLVFTVIFPYAGAAKAGGAFSLSFLARQFMGLNNMPLYAVLAALLLHGLGIERPGTRAFPLDALIYTSIVLYYFSLGLNFGKRDLRAQGEAQISLALIKFVLLPAATWLVLSRCDIDAGVKAVIFIQSFMPAAIYSVVTSILFDLDTRLASGLFVVNTLVFIIIVLPLLMLLVGAL
jgi:predicted permease